ncbi:hypothetical protein C2845_PM06G25000 [Panicum miliaceum]|uniref:Condensin II complex subunit H2 N-terminal domain-containing protein n=1 Tax=Panicum miliaceum TaxID=4540 RepID=A0A3L6R981_PANMI|nr:hypothetical protein C2845_PM06G25000 [Panicum miliaceum]
MDSGSDGDDGSSGRRFPILQANWDLESNWEVDVAKRLEEYLLKICSGKDGAHAVNFAEGVRKEEIRVEVLDARYLVICTELADAAAAAAGVEEDNGRRRGFDKKFRLSGMVDVDGIAAEYTHDVLTVTVPRMHTRAWPAIGLLGTGPARESAARAA